MIRLISSTELEERIDEWWQGYGEIFPSNERFNRQEFSRFLGDSSTDYFNQIQIAELDSKIEGVQISKVFPEQGFMMGLYIWTTPALRGRSVGGSFHEFSKTYALDERLLFVSEVDMDNDIAWFNRQGIVQLPVTYYQPPVGDSREWICMRLMVDGDTTPPILQRKKIRDIVESIYEGVYHLDTEDFAGYVEQGIEGTVAVSKGLKFQNIDVDTPTLLMSIPRVKYNYERFKALLSAGEVFYPIKANSDRAVLDALASLDSGFECASVGEVEYALQFTTPERILFSNTIRTREELHQIIEYGVRNLVIDNNDDLDLLSQHQARCLVRVSTGNDDKADWPLDEKFGVPPEQALELITEISGKVETHGIAFHVGSQVKDPSLYVNAIRIAADIFANAEDRGISLTTLNLGGGLPVSLKNSDLDVRVIANSIKESLERYFGDQVPQIVYEPGRFIVGSAGVLKTTVKSIRDVPGQKWVYVDAGFYNGMVETVGGIRYHVSSEKSGEPINVILAGPTCDTIDIIDRDAQLPNTISRGDSVYFHGIGAYCIESSSPFNGFKPVTVKAIDKLI